jgi:hypothetical protein
MSVLTGCGAIPGNRDTALRTATTNNLLTSLASVPGAAGSGGYAHVAHSLQPVPVGTGSSLTTTFRVPPRAIGAGGTYVSAAPQVAQSLATVGSMQGSGGFVEAPSTLLPANVFAEQAFQMAAYWPGTPLTAEVALAAPGGYPYGVLAAAATPPPTRMIDTRSARQVLADQIAALNAQMAALPTLANVSSSSITTGSDSSAVEPPQENYDPTVQSAELATTAGGPVVAPVVAPTSYPSPSYGQLMPSAAAVMSSVLCRPSSFLPQPVPQTAVGTVSLYDAISAARGGCYGALPSLACPVLGGPQTAMYYASPLPFGMQYPPPGVVLRDPRLW